VRRRDDGGGREGIAPAGAGDGFEGVGRGGHVRGA
jgi:hypothetical protein